jgi:hypothetical protein
MTTTAEPQTIPDDIRKAAYDLGAAIRHHIAATDPELIQHDATIDDMIAMVILAERERCAVVAEQIGITEAMPGYRTACLALKIAGRAVRRGRHLTASEKMENVLRWAEDEETAA